MSYVLVIDTTKQPCNPCHPAFARLLLKQGKAAVFRRFPFVIILKEVNNAPLEPLRLKIDPGSKTTGIAIVNDETGMVLQAVELAHRGSSIKNALVTRSSLRRNRRSRKMRYRPARFDNRKKPDGWLPPSLMSRVDNTLTIVKRFMHYAPIKAISLELVRFDTQLMQNAEMSGIQYQQGELAGYEVREYLLEKYKRQCAYCKKSGIPLQIEHIIPVSRGGTHRIANLTLACRPCNQTKGNKTAYEFGYPHVQNQAKIPLKDAAVLNATRWKLYESLLDLPLPLEVGTGGRTKYNRVRLNLPKTHWLDAACVGASTPQSLSIKNIKPLCIKATGHGNRQMCKMDSYGFPRTSAKGAKRCFGYQTGDMVVAIVTKGKKTGTYSGKIAIRTSGSFNLTTDTKTIQGINYKYLKKIHACDGYSYHYVTSASSEPLKGPVSALT